MSVIIAAGGDSERFGQNISKQFVLLQDEPILIHSLRNFFLLENLSEIIIVTNDIKATGLIVKKNPEYDSQKIKIVLGGKLRQDSVYNGFCNVSSSSNLVLIHDVARPLFEIEDVKNCIRQALISGAAILAVPVVDTIKQSKIENGKLFVKNTLNREELYLVQTPQVFNYELLANVYKSRDMHKHVSTDEASMIEHLGNNVSIVIGNRTNIKITYPEDLKIAEAILKDQKLLCKK